jgi:hypothetical protein
MTQTTFTLDETFVGQVLGPPDGYITDLSMTQPPTSIENPYYDEGERRWKAGYFQLRATGENYDHICFDPRSNGAAMSWAGGTGWLFTNRNVAYRGNLIALAIPRGSVWSLVLSDIPVARVAPSIFDGVLKMRELFRQERERELQPVLR